MIFEVNGVGVDDKKSLLHYKIWDVFMNEKGNLIKGGYSERELTSLVLYFLQAIATGEIFQGSCLFCYRGLGIN